MINLIKADLYKETRKNSFKIILLMLLLVSFVSIFVLSKTYKEKNDIINKYDLYNKEEYKLVNKHGDYDKYKNDYKKYEYVVNNKDKLNVNNCKVINILEYKNSFLYFIGVIVIFLSFNSLSYDYNKGTLKYIVLNKQGKIKLLLSKILSQIIIGFILISLFSLFYLIFGIIRFNVNLLEYYKYIYIFNCFIKLPYLLYYFILSIIFIVPYSFIIIFVYMLVIIFKGNTISLVVSNLMYLFSLVISQFLLIAGIDIVKYTFMPYLDFTYFNDLINLSVNNMIFNTNINLESSLFYLTMYSVLFLLISLNIFNRRDIQ